MPRAWKAMMKWLTVLHKDKKHEEVQVVFDEDIDGESDGSKVGLGWGNGHEGKE